MNKDDSLERNGNSIASSTVRASNIYNALTGRRQTSTEGKMQSD